MLFVARAEREYAASSMKSTSPGGVQDTSRHLSSQGPRNDFRGLWHQMHNGDLTPILMAHLYGPAARCKPKVMIWKVGLAHLYPAY
jgi:hypothetical protein